MLAGAQKLAGTPQPQIFLGNAESVGGFLHDAHALLGHLVNIFRRDQNAIGLFMPPANASPQLVQLA